MKTVIFFFVFALSFVQASCQDKNISAELYRQLKVDRREGGLFFPAAVQRFYADNQFQPVWIKPQESMGVTWQAMLMLDCVLQFGLAHADYHPYELSYDSLHTMMEHPEKLGADVKARFEIVLTDALITFMNHLHYGKFNPEYTPERLDRAKELPFLAEKALKEALMEKDFMSAVADVQPRSKAYRDLQAYMRLIKGQYAGDCYEIPEKDVRLVAINMERLRWSPIEDVPSLQVNIPAYTLELYEPDSTYSFKVIVGKPENPTASLNNAVGYFTIAPDHNVLQKRFPNSFDIYLHDSPDQRLSDRRVRTFYRGCIRVQRATDLAAQLLRYDGAADQIPLMRKNVKNYLRHNFMLKKPIPMKITYLTCAIKNGALERYKDIYNLDQLLEAKLYNIQQRLAFN